MGGTEKSRADLARGAGVKELDAWGSLGTFETLKEKDITKAVVTTSRALT